MTYAPIDGPYGSGRRTVDEMKAASSWDALEDLIRKAGQLVEHDPSRWELEGRIGREAVRLWEIRARLDAATP
jgi:hypothetical protein